MKSISKYLLLTVLLLNKELRSMLSYAETTVMPGTLSQGKGTEKESSFGRIFGSILDFLFNDDYFYDEEDSENSSTEIFVPPINVQLHVIQTSLLKPPMIDMTSSAAQPNRDEIQSTAQVAVVSNPAQQTTPSQQTTPVHAQQTSPAPVSQQSNTQQPKPSQSDNAVQTVAVSKPDLATATTPFSPSAEDTQPTVKP